MNLIFDTHAHYDDEAFDADREALLASMPENGVGLIVDPGCDLDTSRRAVEIAEQYPHVYAAVGWHPENCISVYEALRMYTANAAYSSFEENIKGTITEGKLADFVVLDEDIFAMAPEKIKDIKVCATYLGGRAVYERD